MTSNPIEALWVLLDAEIAAAVPLQRKIRELTAKAEADPQEFELDLLEAQLEKYKQAGKAPGLAEALAVLLPDDFADYKAVVKHAQLRLKAAGGGPAVETPMGPGVLAGSTTPGTAVTPLPGETPDTAVPAEPLADPVADEPAPKAKRGRKPRDPGPTVDDIPVDEPVTEVDSPAELSPKIPGRIAGDPNLEALRKHDPEAYNRVTTALENAAKRLEEENASKLPANQAAAHAQDLPEPEPAAVSEEFEAGGEETNPDDVAAMLAALEEE